MRNYVIINGVNSNTKTGLAIKELPPISKPAIRTNTETIDGRDGDIVTRLGYSAYDKQIEIGLFNTFDIDEIIAFFNQSGTITFSNETDKYYRFEISFNPILDMTKYIRKPKTINSCIKKRIIAANTFEIGVVSLGKYTLPKTPALLVNVLAFPDKQPAK